MDVVVVVAAATAVVVIVAAVVVVVRSCKGIDRAILKCLQRVYERWRVRVDALINQRAVWGWLCWRW